MTQASDIQAVGERIYELADRIYPICRSITGNGVRQTLEILKELVPELEVHEVKSGVKAFDWTVPKEWNIQEAYIENCAGEHLIDFCEHNLHVMGYSLPVDRWVDLEELKNYIFTEPGQPEAIPYVTSYYKERFGFCMSQRQMEKLEPGQYHMVIKSSLEPGSMTYADLILPGETEQEILITTYICHPSMANNECSGPALLTYLIQWLKEREKRKYTYRLVFVPETIGTIVYLSKHYQYMKKNVIAGFNLSCVGDNGAFSMVETRYGNTLADKVMKNILESMETENSENPGVCYSYLKRGSDERQYNSPGIELPVIVFSRTKFGEYEQYHTSLDDMDFISAQGLQESYELLCLALRVLENNCYYKMNILCEPQLGKLNLYPTVSRKGSYKDVKATMDFMAYADGRNDLLDISNLIMVPMTDVLEIAEKLEGCGIISKFVK